MKTKIIILLLGMLSIILLNGISIKKEMYHPAFRESYKSSSFGISEAVAYPPAVGILSNSENCLSCHVNNGPWKDNENTIIDIIDKETKQSFKQKDNTFVIEAFKNKPKTVLTIIGSKKNSNIPPSYRNAWLYIDPKTIGNNSLSKFAPNWEVNLQMSCRLVGDNLAGYEDANITSLPMTIQPLENAQEAEISLQVMLTKDESVKGKATEGMLGSYFERKVKLKVKVK